MEANFPYLARNEDRYGNERLYVRRHGKRIRIREKEGTEAFAKAYAAALVAPGDRANAAETAFNGYTKGTLGWLGAKYFASGAFKKLAEKSRKARRSCLEECFREPLRADDLDPMGNCPLR